MTESTRTVREFALEIPGATRIFEKLGIDYCCGGSQSLADACATAGVAVDEVLGSLKTKAECENSSDGKDWQIASHKDLITHIVGKLHTYTREELGVSGFQATRVRKTKYSIPLRSIIY